MVASRKDRFQALGNEAIQLYKPCTSGLGLFWILPQGSKILKKVLGYPVDVSAGLSYEGGAHDLGSRTRGLCARGVVKGFIGREGGGGVELSARPR